MNRQKLIYILFSGFVVITVCLLTCKIVSAEKCNRVRMHWQAGPIGSVICIYGFSLDATDIKRDFIVSLGTFDVNNNMNQASFTGYENGNQLIWGDISGNENCYCVADQECGQTFKDECAAAHIFLEPERDQNSGGFNNVIVNQYYKDAKYENDECVVTNNDLQIAEVDRFSHFYSDCLFKPEKIPSIAAGYYHTVALRNDGTVWTWGRNTSAQLGDGTTTDRTIPIQVNTLTDVKDVAAGYYHTVALRDDGTVWAWGYNGMGQLGNGTTDRGYTPIQVSEIDNVIAIAAGGYHTAALRGDGTVWTWGYNDSGQIGDGTTSYQANPIRISELTNIVAIAAGSYHTIALDDNGIIWAWGDNEYGQLGDGSKSNQTAPVRVDTLTDITAISAGRHHTTALRNDGTVWTWGRNEYGELGNGTTSDSTEPVQVAGLAHVAKIDAGYRHTIVLKDDKTVWTWGHNWAGQIGDGTTSDNLTPVQIANLTDVTAISAGYHNTLTVQDNGTVWGWGGNSYGELGDGTVSPGKIPAQVTYLANITAIAAGAYHTIALKNDGTVWTCGDNKHGHLGDGTRLAQNSPVPVINLADVTAISAGYHHTLALQNNGTVWAWGENKFNQLGDGTTSNRTIPVQVLNLTQITDIVAGDWHTFAIQNNDIPWVWGYNGWGQFGDGTNTSTHTPFQLDFSDIKSIAAGLKHTAMLKNDGSVWTSGKNEYGQLGDGTNTDSNIPIKTSGLTSVIDVAAGDYHTVALKNDGTVWTWGHNDSGQLGDGTDSDKNTPVKVNALTDVITIAAGGYHTLAIQNDRTVWAWGGQIGDGTFSDRTAPVQVANLNRIIAIDGGDGHSIALRDDGTVWTWGGNHVGQIGNGTDTWTPRKAGINLIIRREKAIIVAGGGPYPGNNIWEGTEMCANLAYRTIVRQGYDKDSVYYLSHNKNVDLDGNGLFDDVDSDSVTNTSLKSTITEWARDAKNLLIYMVDHGGKGTFRMSAAEILYATELDIWLDEIQEIIPGNVTLIYDACRSGSFVSILTPPAGKTRIIATSTSSDREALFSVKGKSSFSYIFWTSMFKGDSFYKSFYDAADVIGLLYDQVPQLEADGDGLGNQTVDQDIAMDLKIGNEDKYLNDVPVIESISVSPETLNSETSASIYAENVTDADGIKKVWAVITPPGFSTDSPDTPADLPTIDLESTGNNNYSGAYDNFTTAGTYDITVFVIDDTEDEMISVPIHTTVTKCSDSNWATISGTVLYNETPVCAMVLANGQYMFSCAGAGRYSLTVPPDENGEITIFAFVDGLAPFKEILTPENAVNFDINMSACADCPKMNLTNDTEFTDSGWVRIRGSVLNENGTPLCAMVLANGQHMFSCAGDGKYDLEVPLDENGEITLFGFCDGFQPYKDILKP